MLPLCPSTSEHQRFDNGSNKEAAGAWVHSHYVSQETTSHSQVTPRHSSCHLPAWCATPAVRTENISLKFVLFLQFWRGWALGGPELVRRVDLCCGEAHWATPITFCPHEKTNKKRHQILKLPSALFTFWFQSELDYYWNLFRQKICQSFLNVMVLYCCSQPCTLLTTNTLLWYLKGDDSSPSRHIISVSPSLQNNVKVFLKDLCS